MGVLLNFFKRVFKSASKIKKSYRSSSTAACEVQAELAQESPQENIEDPVVAETSENDGTSATNQDDIETQLPACSNGPTSIYRVVIRNGLPNTISVSVVPQGSTSRTTLLLDPGKEISLISSLTTHLGVILYHYLEENWILLNDIDSLMQSPGSCLFESFNGRPLKIGLKSRTNEDVIELCFLIPQLRLINNTGLDLAYKLHPCAIDSKTNVYHPDATEQTPFLLDCASSLLPLALYDDNIQEEDWISIPLDETNDIQFEKKGRPYHLRVVVEYDVDGIDKTATLYSCYKETNVDTDEISIRTHHPQTFLIRSKKTRRNPPQSKRNSNKNCLAPILEEGKIDYLAADHITGSVRETVI